MFIQILNYKFLILNEFLIIKFQINFYHLNISSLI